MTELNDTSFVEAIRAETPVIVDFWADWCMPCRIFSPVLEELSDEMDGQADFCKLNIDEYPDIAQKYEITSIPTLFVFKNSQVVDRLIGVQPKNNVMEMIKKHL